MSVDLLSQNITATKSLKPIQNQSVTSRFGARMGEIVIEWSVANQMLEEGQTTDLDVGTYYIKAPQPVSGANSNSWDRLFIPKGTIIIAAHVDTHLAKAGSGTITLSIGSDALTAINAAGYTNDTAALAANLLSADADVKVVIAGDVVTAGAFTLVLQTINGNVV